MKPAFAGKVRLTVRLLLVAAFGQFLATSVLTGWRELSTDFPNYYTAAFALCHRVPLAALYDWTSFAREMGRAGIDRHLGAWSPNPPLAMLPVLALEPLSPLDAKRVWLVVNLAMLAGAVALLAHSTGIWWEAIALLAFCGHASLAANFVYGQYYVFLLLATALTFWWFDREKAKAAGFACGVAAGLKLYTAPLIIYFAARRKWSAVFGMLAALALLGVLSIALFGWSDVLYYGTHVFPRALAGGGVDPYDPADGALSTLFRRLFMREPELNPHPWFDGPWFFFFGYTAVKLAVVGFTALGVAATRAGDSRHSFAWFVVTILLISTSLVTYTFLLLLVPVTLLLPDASPRRAAYLAATFVLLNLHLNPAWLFPKVWLLLALWVVVGAEHWRTLGARWALLCAAAVVLLSLAAAQRDLSAYNQEPGRRYPEIAVEPGALFSGYPAITRAGLFYQGMGAHRYVLRWLHDGRIDRITADGTILHPTSTGPDAAIRFELAVRGASSGVEFDPLSGVSTPAPLPASPAAQRILSPDGRWAAFTRISTTGEELWVHDLTTGGARQLAGGECNNSSPAWELDSSALGL